jgi:hypothetical protein
MEVMPAIRCSRARLVIAVAERDDVVEALGGNRRQILEFDAASWDPEGLEGLVDFRM